MGPYIVGKVIPQFKDLYDATYNYDILDECQSGAAIYRSKKPNNLGHPVTDKNWWIKTFDAGAAIDEATKNNQATPSEQPVQIARLMGIGVDGQIYSIRPAALVQYVLEELQSYNIICKS